MKLSSDYTSWVTSPLLHRRLQRQVTCPYTNILHLVINGKIQFCSSSEQLCSTESVDSAPEAGEPIDPSIDRSIDWSKPVNVTLFLLSVTVFRKNDRKPLCQTHMSDIYRGSPINILLCLEPRKFCVPVYLWLLATYYVCLLNSRNVVFILDMKKQKDRRKSVHLGVIIR